jgi:TolB-like protein
LSFFEELKRRNVIRVGVAYTVAAWLLAQVVQLAAESFEAPAWVMKMLITVLVLGLPITLIFSWAYELTPDGIRREKEVAKSASITHQTAKKLDYLTILLLLGVLGVVVLDRFILEPNLPPTSPANAELVRESDSALPSIEKNSIAVLPFVNMSADPEQAFFSEGISEELLNLLVRVDGLTVASRTSSFAYKGDNPNIPQIARDLKVAHILEGSVRKAGNQVRITAQLIDTSNDRHLWSDTYDRELDDIFAIQDEIANAIVNALRTELGMDATEKAVNVTAVTENLDAYELYLKGRALIAARRDLDEAVRLLERAVSLDPEFARAWAELGAAAYLCPAWNITDRDYLAIASHAIDKAIELDSDLSMAWAVRSRLQSTHGSSRDFSALIENLNIAIEKDSLNATAWLWRGASLSELGFHQQGLADIQKCLEIDPAYKNCLLHIAIIHVLTGNDEQADVYFERLATEGFLTYTAIHVPYLFRKGRNVQAKLAAHHISRHPDFPAREWFEALQYPNRDHHNAIPKAEKWLKADPHIGVSAALMLAFGGYDRITIEGGLVMNWIWQPGFPGFHESGHFKRIATELGLVAYWREFGYPPQCRAVGDDDFECDVP